MTKRNYLQILHGLYFFSFYFIIGWGVPVLMTTAWAITTGMNSNSHCWFGYSHTLYYWIVEGPRLALIAVSLFFACKFFFRCIGPKKNEKLMFSFLHRWK